MWRERGHETGAPNKDTAAQVTKKKSPGRNSVTTDWQTVSCSMSKQKKLQIKEGSVDA